MEHVDSHLATDGIELSADVLDRIDEIVPPGVTINVAGNMWNVGTTALGAASRGRWGNRPRLQRRQLAPEAEDMVRRAAARRERRDSERVPCGRALSAWRR